VITTHKHLRVLIAQLKQCGLHQVVVSPGSRNAPIILALQEHKLRLYSVVDERSAAFVALGMAQQQKEPVALVCTSGTALLNYAPAMAEAYYQGVPLLVLSADRPEHLIDIGDGQAIRQRGVFQNFSKLCLQVESDSSIDTINTLARKVFMKLLQGRKGPVHVNLPLQEPLYDDGVGELQIEPLEPKEEKVDLLSNIETFRSAWSAAEKKAIIVGQGIECPEVSRHLAELADEGVLILKENTSNLNVPNAVSSIDRWLAAIDYKIDSFDILVTFGGHLVSKRIKKLLRETTPSEHWFIGLEEPLDIFFCLTHHIKQTPIDFFNALRMGVHPPTHPVHHPSLKNYHQSIEVGNDYLKHIPFSDLKVMDEILRMLPNGINLHLGNSSVVRYAQLFEPNPSVTYLSNRGTAGIDGSLSTVIGYAFHSKQENYAIIGDLSFFYDSNAFWNQMVGSNVKVIVINNGGGGIFRYIDGPTKVPEFERLFEGQHDGRVEGICQAFHLEYQKASNETELRVGLKHLINSQPQRGMILEVFTPREQNAEILKDYFKTIKNNRL